MTYAKPNFDRSKDLSTAEAAALARAALERARRALHHSRTATADPVHQRFRAAFAGTRKNFEFFTIAACVIGSGTACLVQSSGLQFS